MVRLGLVACLCAVSCGSAPGPEPQAPQPGVAPVPERDPLDADALMADVRALCSDELEGRGSYQPGGVRAAAFMETQLAAAGLEIRRQPVANGAETVIGIKRAGDRAVLVSAHYDHLGVDAMGTVYLGADDNASGAAILLGMARAARDVDFEHTILFVAFGAEEDALAGSGVYVADPVWPLENTIGVINFDMVGRNFFEAGADQPAAAAVVGLDEIEGAKAAARAGAEQAGLKIIPAPARLLELFGFDDRTDDWWFRRRGVPAVHFSTGLHDDYHQPTDTPDKIVPAQLERIARTATALLAFMAGARPL